MKLLRIISGCPEVVRKWRISMFCIAKRPAALHARRALAHSQTTAVPEALTMSMPLFEPSTS